MGIPFLDGKRGGLFVMKWAEPFIGSAAAFEFYMA
jgi:hypothetical protein